MTQQTCFAADILTGHRKGTGVIYNISVLFQSKEPEIKAAKLNSAIF